MKTKPTASLLLPIAALLFGAPAVFADVTETPADAPFAPKEHPLSRYDDLNKKSPFEFDPPKEEQAIASDPFEGVSLAGYCGSGNTMTVYLIAGKEKKRISVYGDGSPYKKRDDSGFRVIGINRGKTLKATSIVLEKDGRQGEVTFEEETLRPKGGGAGAQPQQNVQMVPGPDGRMTPRPVIPRPGGNIIQQQPYQAPQAFIPGRANQPQAPQPGSPAAGAVPGVNNMSNQQLVNHLTGPNAPQQGVVNPQPVVPQQTTGDGERPRSGVPSPRRRVVLPTQP